MNINHRVTTENEVDDTPKSPPYNYSSPKYSYIAYGPITVRLRHSSTPTLKSGRHSKFLPLEGEAARQRELKREKNRETARRLKEKRDNIERRLGDELQELQSVEKYLIQDIDNLKAYKQFLEERYQQQILIESEPNQTTQVEHQQCKKQNESRSHNNSIDIKEEPYPSPPDWRLAFSI